MSMEFPANPTVGQIAQLGAFNYQCVATAPSQWDVIGDAEVQNIGGYNLVEAVALANLPFFDVSVDPNYDYVFEMEGHFGTTSDSVLTIIPDDGSGTFNIPWSVNSISAAALVNTVGSLAFQELDTTNDIPIAGGQASPNGTSYAHIELNMNGNATGDVAVVTSKAMSFNAGALYQTHETIARARALVTVKSLRIGMVFSGTFNNFLSGRVLVYRRSRQPLSFLTGREPGGMYRYADVPLIGSPYWDITFEPGYDYDIEVNQAYPALSTDYLLFAVSTDGVNFPATGFSGVYHFGAAGQPVTANLIANNAVICGSDQDTNNGGSGGFLKVRNADAGQATNVYNDWFNTTVIALAVNMARAEHGTADGHVAGRIYWNTPGQTFAGGFGRIYRRNRAITYS